MSDCTVSSATRKCLPRVPDLDPNVSYTLEAIVNHYKKNDFEALEEYVSRFGSILDCICGGFGNKREDLKFKKNSHQYRLTRATILKAEEELSEKLADSYPDFESLINDVEKITEPIDGFGPLAVYDFALRYGNNLNLRPLKKVYVHNGTLEGALALQAANLIEKVEAVMPVEAFPEILQELGSMHIESLLCIYKTQLKNLKTN